mmetsp:Transcript_16476/g.33635  ORF Transcript_16476/g.33635 Transcript_16476/m.33635 type:complete len:89 (+) Transcript_16476:1595-1861(+)
MNRNYLLGSLNDPVDLLELKLLPDHSELNERKTPWNEDNGPTNQPIDKQQIIRELLATPTEEEKRPTNESCNTHLNLGTRDRYGVFQG